MQSVKANEVVESLENLNCDHYRKLYRRKTEYSFCGDQVTEVTSQILSTGTYCTHTHTNIVPYSEIPLWCILSFREPDQDQERF